MKGADVQRVLDNFISKMSTPLTKEEIKKSREYWGSMPWHPKGMKHPALRKPRSRNKRIR